MKWTKKHIISIKDFSREEIDFILKKSAVMESLLKKGRTYNLMRNKILASLFFEPSTRTRLSFEAAMLRLGGNVIGFSGETDTSVKKGETIIDTLRMAASYSDLIVMRNSTEGSARLAAEHVDKPLINGGDGANQHPTQTLLDLYTIQKEFKKIDGLNIAMVGDLKYGRTVHSLANALENYKVRLRFISPEELRMPDYITSGLRKGRIHFEETKRLKLDRMDVVYVTRIQQERFPDPQEYEKVKGAYVLDEKILPDLKKDAIIMHPLPRVTEISHRLDSTKHARYFEQAQNGIPVRMALICLVSGVDF